MPEILFHKVVGLQLETLAKEKLQHRYFPISFTKFVRRPKTLNRAADCED